MSDRFSNVMDEINLGTSDIERTQEDISQFTEAQVEFLKPAKQTLEMQSTVFANSMATGPMVRETCADVYAACPQLDWPVVLEPLVLQDGTKTPIKATVRLRPDGGREFLGPVKGRYNVLQGAELKSIPNPYVEAGLLTPTAAGVWRGKAWIQCDIAGAYNGALGLKGHVTLGTSFDGSMATKWGQSITRIVCMNTLAHAMAETRNSRRHTVLGNRLALREMTDWVANLSESFQQVADTLRIAAQQDCDEQTFRSYINATFAEDSEDVGDRVYQAVYNSWQNPRGESFQPTMSGAYNAVTQYLTHERGRSPEARFDSVNFGLSRQVSERALALLG